MNPGAAMWSRPQLGKGDSRAIEPAARGTLYFQQRANAHRRSTVTVKRTRAVVCELVRTAPHAGQLGWAGLQVGVGHRGCWALGRAPALGLGLGAVPPACRVLCVCSDLRVCRGYTTRGIPHPPGGRPAGNACPHPVRV